jgi:pimeloyl-ACP methyl ester carboxylesterase
MGGVNLRLFASEHLDEVAGLVLVDAMGDEQPSCFWATLPAADLAEFQAGVAKLPEGLDFDTLVAGLADMRTSSRSIGDRPLVVLTHGKDEAPPGTPPEQTARARRVWREMQADLPGLSTNAVQVVAENSGHFLQLDAPKLVIAAVREVVQAARTHSRLDAHSLAPLAAEPPP